MPTVANIVDYVCNTTGWNAAASSVERVAVLAFVNQAWMDASLSGENRVSLQEAASETLASGQYRYLLDTDFGFTHSSDWPSRILGMSVTGNGVDYLNMRQVSLSEMREMRDGTDDVTGHPMFWCQADARQILIYPTPGTAYTLRMDYVVYPTALTEDATGNELLNETIVPKFHRTLLGSRAIAMCFEQDGVEEKSSFWHSKADRAAEEYQGHVNTQGGIVQPLQGMWFRNRRSGSPYTDRSVDWR